MKISFKNLLLLHICFYSCSKNEGENPEESKNDVFELSSKIIGKWILSIAPAVPLHLFLNKAPIPGVTFFRLFSMLIIVLELIPGRNLLRHL